MTVEDGYHITVTRNRALRAVVGDIRTKADEDVTGIPRRAMDEQQAQALADLIEQNGSPFSIAGDKISVVQNS